MKFKIDEDIKQIDREIYTVVLFFAIRFFFLAVFSKNSRLG